MPHKTESFAPAITFEQLFKRNYGSAKIGVFGCGLWAYWSQFPGLREKLKATRAEEIARGATLSGPHRDEIRFVANGVDLGTYGSRGQARTAVLALKLAEMEWMRARTGEWPLLLLDEVLAELDVTRRRDLLSRLGSAEQCVLTTTDLNLFPLEFRDKARVWRVQNGRVMSEV